MASVPADFRRYIVVLFIVIEDPNGIVVGVYSLTACMPTCQ